MGKIELMKKIINDMERAAQKAAMDIFYSFDDNKKINQKDINILREIAESVVIKKAIYKKGFSFTPGIAGTLGVTSEELKNFIKQRKEKGKR